MQDPPRRKRSAKLIDETGNRYGQLVVTELYESGPRGTVWLCKCDCGGERKIFGRHLRTGKSPHGGRLQYCCCECASHPIRAESFCGQRFGKLTVIGSDKKDRRGRQLWRCECDCGNSVSVLATKLIQRGKKSCGCAGPKAKNHCDRCGDVRRRTLGGNKSVCRCRYVRQMLRSARGRARRSGLLFNITEQDISIPDYCPVFTWIRLTIGNDYAHKDSSPSIDRIDSSLGYIKGNVRVISTLANSKKSDMDARMVAALARDSVFWEAETSRARAHTVLMNVLERQRENIWQASESNCGMDPNFGLMRIARREPESQLTLPLFERSLPQ